MQEGLFELVLQEKEKRTTLVENAYSSNFLPRIGETYIIEPDKANKEHLKGTYKVIEVEHKTDLGGAIFMGFTNYLPKVVIQRK